MALQTSGAISLNDIHVEAGGVTQTLASINDSDIRALIGKGSEVTMSFSEWYGASNTQEFGNATWLTRQSGVGHAASSTITTSGYYNNAGSGIDFRVITTASGFAIYVNESHSVADSIVFNAAGSSSTLVNDTEVKIFELSDVRPDSIKIELNLVLGGSNGSATTLVQSTETPAATYNITSGSWQALSQGESMGKRLNTSAIRFPPDGTAYTSGTLYVKIYARKAGYIDKYFGEFRLFASATAL